MDKLSIDLVQQQHEAVSLEEHPKVAVRSKEKNANNNQNYIKRPPAAAYQSNSVIMSSSSQRVPKSAPASGDVDAIANGKLSKSLDDLNNEEIGLDKINNVNNYGGSRESIELDSTSKF